MRIVHTITFPNEEIIRLKLEKMKFNFGDDPVLTVTVEESDPIWSDICSLLDFAIVDSVDTIFDKEELKDSDYLVLKPEWHHGYPMPDNDRGYLDLTYDLSTCCKECGVGLRQKEPFRMKGEPKWSEKNIMQLNWVFDEYFVTPEIWESVFKPLGIQSIPILDFKSGEKLKTVVQLKIEDKLENNIDLKNHSFVVCNKCGQKKYLPYVRGKFPNANILNNNCHIVKTKEYFGSGSSAFNEVVISNKLFGLMDNKIKGVSFHVVGD